MESEQEQKIVALLFTPGPLLTTSTVKEAMLIDYGSRDPLFINMVREIRETILQVAGVEDQYTTILMQGSGSFAVEATLQSAINRSTGKVLIVANGAYGERQIKMCKMGGIDYLSLQYLDNQIVVASDLLVFLEDVNLTHVSMIHSETTSGLLNPVGEVGRLIKQVRPDVKFIVDAMSSFGAYPIQVKEDSIDYLVASSNKCLQGAPGFAFSIVKTSLIEEMEGNSRVLCLDLFDQHKSMNLNGQFRFTPPTHILSAFHQALKEYQTEGGQPARYLRYSNNQ